MNSKVCGGAGSQGHGLKAVVPGLLRGTHNDHAETSNGMSNKYASLESCRFPLSFQFRRRHLTQSAAVVKGPGRIPPRWWKTKVNARKKNSVGVHSATWSYETRAELLAQAKKDGYQSPANKGSQLCVTRGPSGCDGNQ